MCKEVVLYEIGMPYKFPGIVDLADNSYYLAAGDPFLVIVTDGSGRRSFKLTVSAINAAKHNCAQVSAYDKGQK